MGRRHGVFAQRTFRAGETIEVAPVLVISEEDRDIVLQTDLRFYVQEWPSEGRPLALPLGYGAMYSHASTPSAWMHKRLDDMIVDVVAGRDIVLGEEITLDHRTLSQPSDPAR